MGGKWFKCTRTQRKERRAGMEIWPGDLPTFSLSGSKSNRKSHALWNQIHGELIYTFEWEYFQDALPDFYSLHTSCLLHLQVIMFVFGWLPDGSGVISVEVFHRPHWLFGLHRAWEYFYESLFLFAPVMNRAPGDARCETASATSSGWPIGASGNFKSCIQKR